MYAVGSIVGLLIYNRFYKKLEFKKIFTVTTLLSVALGYTQLILVTRANVKLGIPDRLFCVGDSVIIQLIAEINSIPLLVLACRMCPKNIEGTMYALIMGSFNFGSILSSQFGGVLTYYMGITDSDFKNLGLLIFVTNSIQLLPLLLLGMIDT